MLDPYGDDHTSMTDPDAAEIKEEEAKAGFDWGNLFDFGGTLVENSGQLASVFSPNYRQDQIELSQNQKWYQSGAPQFGGNQNPRTNNFIVVVIIAIIIVIVLVLMLRKKGEDK